MLLLLAAAAALFCLLDAWYLLRLPLALLRAHWLQPPLREPLREQSWAGRVLPSDLDWLLHMNNARYLREADLARCAHLARIGFFRALRALGGRALLAASCARHRRPLRLWERFAVRTRLLGWDARAFYLEQRFVCARDGFVCALLLCRLHVEGCSPAQVMQHLGQRQVDSPELPEEVQLWVRYNEASSQKLRAESGLGAPPRVTQRRFPGPSLSRPDQARASNSRQRLLLQPLRRRDEPKAPSARQTNQPSGGTPRSSAESVKALSSQ